MFPVSPRHIQRVSFATKLFPRVNSPLGADTGARETQNNGPDSGGTFCGGRSRNRDLLAYFGFIADSQRGASTFAQLPLFRRSIKKLTAVVERELESVGAHEVLMPTLIPKKLWRESKRTERQQDALQHVYSLQDSAGNELLLGPTYEESITQLVRDLDPPREHELPLMLYQTSHKFRYEPNPRFGLLRSNEFLMNDLYSFDSTLDRAKETYNLMTNVYEKIFNILGMSCMRFESATGGIGGKYSHEYQLPVSSGEDHVIQCNSCSYAFNEEMRQKADNNKNTCLKCGSTDIKRMQMLELAHTFLLSDTYSKSMKTQFKREDGTKVNYEMGCFGLGLSRILGAGLDLYSFVPKADDESFFQMRWPNQVAPYKMGIVTPARRSKQFNAGSSEFIERLVNKTMVSNSEIDILVEDRDKEGIYRRLAKLRSLGIPNIVVVGQRFLQETPEVEVLTLESDKINYKQHWMSQDQLLDFIKRLEIY